MLLIMYIVHVHCNPLFGNEDTLINKIHMAVQNTLFVHVTTPSKDTSFCPKSVQIREVRLYMYMYLCICTCKYMDTEVS